MANHHNASYHPEISSSPDLFHLDSSHGGEPLLPSQLDMSYDDRDSESVVQNDFNLIPYPDSSTPSSVAASTEGPGSCSPPLPLSDNLEPGAFHSSFYSTSPQPRAGKPLKDRARIDLAPDQPPTTQGRPRARVFVACLQWYARSPH